MLQKEQLPAGVDVVAAETAGLDLLHLLEDYARTIVVDAIVTGAAPGTIHIFHLDDLPGFPLQHPTLAHELDLVTTLQLGKKLEMNMPRQIDIVAVEAQEITLFSDQLSLQVAQAIPRILQTVQRCLQMNFQTPSSC